MATDPTPQKQFFTFTEAVLLPVYQSNVTLTRLWEAYLAWWTSEGERAFGGVPLDQNDFNEFLGHAYGKPNREVNGIAAYSGLYINYR